MGLTKGSMGIKIIESGDKDKKYDFTIGLAGNPNVGKSTVFNTLTGLNQHTGNWPGKTVTNAEGLYEHNDKKIRIIDLPGTYSLLSDSEEEEIARDYICFENPDVVVIVADATSLERNLNLFIQISEITDNIILCVNLMDEANKRGISINEGELSNILNIKVIKTSATDKVGFSELKDAINEIVINNQNKVRTITYSEDIEFAIKSVEELLKDFIMDNKKKRWISLRLLEGNKKIKAKIKMKFNIDEIILQKISEIAIKTEKHMNNKCIGDELVEQIIKRAEEVTKAVVKNKTKYDDFSKKVDKVLVSRMTGIPVMILLLILILWTTITLANYPSQVLSYMFEEIGLWLKDLLQSVILPKWIEGILMDGVYATLTWVISVMLPPMAIFFPMFTLLEDLGYLPRIAFNLDKCFRKCSSCGKQALTMCMGLGCNAAGVIGCRIINSPKERFIAILTNVFMPCNGRFPMLITIATVFVGGMAGGFNGSLFSAIIVTTMIILGVFMTLISSKILAKTVLKGTPSHFILELPPYRKPQVGKILLRSLIDRTLFVLARAIAVAAPAGAIIWIFANVMIGDSSVLMYCTSFFDPFAKIIGIDGYIAVAFILGLPANEIVMPIMIMSYLKQSTMINIDGFDGLKEVLLANGWTTLTVINTMILCIMHFPCATTLLTIKKETDSIKWPVIAFILPTILGIGLCFLTTIVYRIVA
ncbi:ferrous iron transport protein B [Clostridium beijerinckii]|nr:ferrous iron transport protein B [Clostridium beijerinckii]